jgi:hypothetical protein
MTNDEYLSSLVVRHSSVIQKTPALSRAAKRAGVHHLCRLQAIVSLRGY